MQEKVGRRLPGVPYVVYSDERGRADRLLEKVTRARKTLSDVKREVYGQAYGAFFQEKRLERDIKLRERVGEVKCEEMLREASAKLLSIRQIWAVLKPQDNLYARLTEDWNIHLRVESQIREGNKRTT